MADAKKEMLTKNFSRDELACKCGCKMIPVPELLSALQELRDHWGKPLKVTSAARCPSYNAKIGGSKNSQHMKGKAVDLLVQGQEAYDLVHLAYLEGHWHGIAIAKTFVHLDIRPQEERMTWVY